MQAFFCSESLGLIFHFYSLPRDFSQNETQQKIIGKILHLSPFVIDNGSYHRIITCRASLCPLAGGLKSLGWKVKYRLSLLSAIPSFKYTANPSSLSALCMYDEVSSFSSYVSLNATRLVNLSLIWGIFFFYEWFKVVLSVFKYSSMGYTQLLHFPFLKINQWLGELFLL